MHDPSAAVGVPAHVTVIYPFKPPAMIDAAVLDTLRDCLAPLRPFDFALSAVRRFPGVIYVAPEPIEELRNLTRSVWKRFPETPPYGGKYPDIMPHLTIAQGADEAELDRIGEKFETASRGKLPIEARVADVALLENRSGRWEIRARFALGA